MLLARETNKSLCTAQTIYSDKNSHTRRNNDDNKQNDNDDNQAYTHLHILPPHLFSNTVGSPTKSLSRSSQTICLILKGIKILSSLRHLIDILTHYTNSIIDLLKDKWKREYQQTLHDVRKQNMKAVKGHYHHV